MNRDYISNTTIEINAPISKVWNALVTPEKAKEYFFGANIESNWEENSPNTFNGEYNGKKQKRSDKFWSGVLSAIKQITEK